jgi:hypothetical protein
MLDRPFAKALTRAVAGPTDKLTPHCSPLTPQRFGVGAFEQAHMLQRSIGNQATLRYRRRPFGPIAPKLQFIVNVRDRSSNKSRRILEG